MTLLFPNSVRYSIFASYLGSQGWHLKVFHRTSLGKQFTVSTQFFCLPDMVLISQHDLCWKAADTSSSPHINDCLLFAVSTWQCSTIYMRWWNPESADSQISRARQLTGLQFFMQNFLHQPFLRKQRSKQPSSMGIRIQTSVFGSVSLTQSTGRCPKHTSSLTYCIRWDIASARRWSKHIMLAERIHVWQIFDRCMSWHVGSTCRLHICIYTYMVTDCLALHRKMKLHQFENFHMYHIGLACVQNHIWLEPTTKPIHVLGALIQQTPLPLANLVLGLILYVHSVKKMTAVVQSEHDCLSCNMNSYMINTDSVDHQAETRLSTYLKCTSVPFWSLCNQDKGWGSTRLLMIAIQNDLFSAVRMTVDVWAGRGNHGLSLYDDTEVNALLLQALLQALLLHPAFACACSCIGVIRHCNQRSKELRMQARNAHISCQWCQES